jgi:predicted nucleotidyltransferase component of viral defense system
MVEQDFLISQAVELIFSDPKLSTQLAMRGGTVLHKGHLAPAARYSEDIDLVLVEPRRSHRGIRDDLANALKPLLGRPTESVTTSVALFVRNIAAKSKIARLTYLYGPTDPDVALAALKVEVNLNETKPLYPLVTVPIQVPTEGSSRSCQVVSYDLNEMLGTKLRALLQREHGRDLFDLWHAWKAAQATGSNTGVDPARVGDAFRFYLKQEGSENFTAADVAAEMDRRMRSSKFLNDMKGYLPVDGTYDPVAAYAEFRDVFLPHL